MRPAFLLLLLSFAFLISCSKSGVGLAKSESAPGFGQPFALAPDQTVVFTPSRASQPTLRVQVAALEDSRCPLGVSCIWAGAAKATVVLNTPNQPSKSAILCLGDCRGTPGQPDGFRETDTAAVSLGPVTYLLTLKAGPQAAADLNGPLLLTVTRK